MKRVHLRMAGSGLNLTLYAGALEALEEAGFEPASVAGVSGGGCVGAAWASGLTAREIQSLLLRFMPPATKILDAPWFPLSWVMGWGFFKMKKLEKEMARILGERGVHTFKDTKVPFACFTTNMNSGLSVGWSSTAQPDAPIAARVVDGMRLPVAMQPGWINGEPHRDGGLTYNYPIDFKFSNQEDDGTPTIGLLFRGVAYRDDAPVSSALTDLLSCVNLMLAATAREHIEDAPWAKTIVLEPAGSPLDFLKSREAAQADFKVGYHCVRDWLSQYGHTLSAP